MVEDVGGLDHLDHEGRLSASEHVRGPDTGENPVSEADAGFGCGHKRTTVGHQGDQGSLAKGSGFP